MRGYASISFGWGAPKSDVLLVIIRTHFGQKLAAPILTIGIIISKIVLFPQIFLKIELLSAIRIISVTPTCGQIRTFRQTHDFVCWVLLSFSLLLYLANIGIQVYFPIIWRCFIDRLSLFLLYQVRISGQCFCWLTCNHLAIGSFKRFW